jgi:hypothetical protein
MVWAVGRFELGWVCDGEGVGLLSLCIYVVGNPPRHYFHDRIKSRSIFDINQSIQHQSVLLHQRQLLLLQPTTSKQHVFPSNPIRLHPQPRRPPNAPHPPRGRRVPTHFLSRSTHQSQTHFGTRLLAVPQRLERLRVGVMKPS